jgi:hypothetical protein
MISALFVQRNGCYWGLPGVDPWDEQRDARTYAGPWPVVAHPPCARWCLLAKAVQGKNGYRVGDDGGCFESALRSVRRHGGVLEHPAFTMAWKAFGLRRPLSLRGKQGFSAQCWQVSSPGEWVTCVAQSAYGHRAQKLTWLLYVGSLPPPDLDWSCPEGSAWVSFCASHSNKREKPRLGKKEASRSPKAFRDLLLNLAGRSTLI